MASERRFWRNFCEGVGRMDLFERCPGQPIADHAVGEVWLHDELVGIFGSRTTGEWTEFGVRQDVPLAPVHDAISLRSDPQLRERIEWLPAATHGADLIRTPIKVGGAALPEPVPAPTMGQDTEPVLMDVLGYSRDRVDALRSKGVVA
jgi:crotonobetainyl-CoA:carnitine CoA-transferase CaiB-like acyl-CoA transferase